MITKKELRKLISDKKKEYSITAKTEKSRDIFIRINHLKEFQDAENILCYWSINDEVQTHDFVIKTAAKKNVFLPVVCDNTLLLKKFNGAENLKTGNSFSILEPDHSDNVNIDEIDLVIVPGVAFDLKGGRIGRGKGYYDRLLADTDVYKIGVCFDFQLVEYIPMDDHDITMDTIIFG